MRLGTSFAKFRVTPGSVGALIRRRHNVLALLAVVASLAAAAMVTLPIPAWRCHAQSWRVPDAPPALLAGLAPDGDVPVFCVAPRKGAARCGAARLVAAGRLRFTPFAGMQTSPGTTPLLTSASFSLLWALADPQGRFKVREDAAALAEDLAGQIDALTRSPVWQREYRPPLSRLLRRVADQTWLAPETQLAFAKLLDAVDPLLHDSLADDLGPVLAPYVSDATWQLVATNSTHVFSLIGGSTLDLSPLATSLERAFRDPAARQALGRLGPRLAATPQAEMLAEHLANSAATVLRREPAVLDLFTRIASDPRLEPPLGHVRDEADAVLRESAELLWGLGGSNSLNSLAGLVMRAALAGESQPMILLVGRREEQLLRYAIPNDVTPLARERES